MIDFKKKSAVLNEKTISVEIDILNPTFFDSIRRKTKVTKIVRQPPLGVLLEIGAIVSKLEPFDANPKEILPMIFERMKRDAEAQIAVLACLFDCRAYPSENTKKLISDNIRPSEALSLVAQLFEFADLNSFTNTTILTKGMGLVNRGEIIASQKNEEEKTFGEPLTGRVVDTDGL